MSKHLEKLLSSKRVLFLQGPMGNFFNQVATWLEVKNIETYKVNLNGGDWFFSDKNIYTACIDYTGDLDGFSAWLVDILSQYDIEAVVCFGDCRKYHQIARLISDKLKLDFFVFEEGYIRPNFITFERCGVNAYSTFSCDFNRQDHADIDAVEADIQEVQNKYYKMVLSAIIYYSLIILFFFKYRNYHHHRGMSPWSELFAWLCSGVRRLRNAIFEPRKIENIIAKHRHQYFVFPLQVHNDSQIKIHSQLKDMQKYIDLVIKDFSENSLPQHHLILKHHPMDRGYRHYGQLIQLLAAQYHSSGRVHYVCDVHLPTLLKNSLGVVTVNSTTGLQALYHDIPVKVLGSAIYDMDGLTDQKQLAEFWINPTAVNLHNYDIFRKNLIINSQLNGAFYGKGFWMD